MAKMIPASFPKELANDPRRSAEKKVFNAFRDQLSDDFEVFYSRPWWGLEEDGSEKHGEADFVVGHRDKGLIFIEVKGGLVTYQPANDGWQSIDRNGIGHLIKDPMDQAMKCLHKFLPAFKRDQIWPRGIVKMTYGVILPDTLAPAANKQVVGKYPKHLFLFSNEFPELVSEWIEARLLRGENEVPPGAAGMQVVNRVVADPTKLSFSLRSVVEGEIAQMDQFLLGFQYQALMNIMKNRKSVVMGGAGTGKTIVALELCSRLAQDNLSVLFLARNHNLLGYVSKLLPSERIKVAKWPDSSVDHAEFKADWIVVDEGQDLNHFELSELSRKAISSNLVVFLDSNQAILNNPKQVAERIDAQELELSINLRNTKAISRVTGNLFEGDIPEAVGPEGVLPSSEVRSGELISPLKTHVLRILSEGLRKQQLAVLTDSTSLRDQIIGVLNASGAQAARFLDWQADAITVETIDDFKGLECEYLIVVLEKPANLSKQLSYVAASRARSRLHVIASRDDNFLVASIEGRDIQ
jgi:hypothetical protein